MNRTVVGVDGSAHSLAALAWAVEHSIEVRVLSVGDPASMPSPDTIERDWLGSLDVDRSQVEFSRAAGRPADALLAEAATHAADVIVVGRHGGSVAVPRAIGGVVHRLVRRSDRPIVVVGAGQRALGPLLVGAGRGEGTLAAVHWVAGHAAAHHVPVTLARVVDLHPIAGFEGPIDVMASIFDPEQLTIWARNEVDALAAELSTAGIEVETWVGTGDTGRRLAELSNDASALVMGKHFDGPITGYFMGRCLHYVLTHARCPVIVVPRS